MKRNKLLAIGLDAGDLVFIKSRREHLPNLSKILDRSDVYNPESPKSLSGSVWPTFYTGSQPGYHGIYQHLLWDPKRMGLKRIDASWCRREPFWKTLDAQGIKSIVLDVPYCFSNELDHSVEITDWGTHGQTLPLAASRPDVLEFTKKFGRSPIGREAPIRKGPKELERIRSVLIDSACRKADFVLSLMGEYEWDLCMPVFGETHRAGHIFYSEQDEPGSNNVQSPLLDVYTAIDDAIGRLVDAVDENETSVMIFSVHGMMRDNNQSGLVNRVIEMLNERFLEEHYHVNPAVKGTKVSRDKKQKGIVSKLREHVPDSLQLAAAKASPDFFRSWVVEQEIIGGMDWAHMPAFALRTDIRSEIRLNLKGREEKGLLEPGTEIHEAYIKWMRDVFLSLVDVDRSHKLVKEVVSIRDTFPGEHSEMLPDYVVMWERVPLATHIHSDLIGDIFIEPYGVRGGDHRDEGFVLLDNKAKDISITPPKQVSDIAGIISQLVSNGEIVTLPRHDDKAETATPNRKRSLAASLTSLMGI